MKKCYKLAIGLFIYVLGTGLEAATSMPIHGSNNTCGDSAELQKALAIGALFDETEFPNRPIDDGKDVPTTVESLDSGHEIGDFVKVLISNPDLETHSYLILQKKAANKWALCTNVMLEWVANGNKWSYGSFCAYHCNVGTIVIRHPSCSNLPSHLARFEGYAYQFEALIQSPILRWKSLVMQNADGSIPLDKVYFVVILDGKAVLFKIPSARIEERPGHDDPSKILRLRAN